MDLGLKVTHEFLDKLLEANKIYAWLISYDRFNKSPSYEPQFEHLTRKQI